MKLKYLLSMVLCCSIHSFAQEPQASAKDITAAAAFKEQLKSLEEYIQKGDIALGSAPETSLLDFARTKTYQTLSKNEKEIIHNSRDVMQATLEGDYKKTQASAEILCQATSDETMCFTAGSLLLPDIDIEAIAGSKNKSIPSADPKKAVSLLSQSCEKGEYLYISCTMLSDIYENGKYGIEKNPDKAKKYEQKSQKMLEELMSK